MHRARLTASTRISVEVGVFVKSYTQYATWLVAELDLLIDAREWAIVDHQVAATVQRLGFSVWGLGFRVWV